MIRKKKFVVFFLLMIIVSSTIASRNTTKTKSIEPLFTLEAKCYQTKHLDYLFLIQQYLARIGIHLNVDYINLSQIGFLTGLLAFRDCDIEILELPCDSFVDSFHPYLYAQNGSGNLAGYHTSMDWDEELGTGRNQWYIDTGMEMTPNDSQEKINLCWEWQHYLIDEILPCLPLFTQKNNRTSFEILVFNMRETRPIIGNRDPSPLFPEKSIGLVVRKFISYAINREELRRVVLGDDYEVIHHPINPNLNEWLNPNSIRYCYNIEAVGILKTIAGFDLVWCPGYNDYPESWPSWEDLCPNNPTSVSVNGISLLIAFGVLSFTSVNLFFLRKLRRRYKIQK